MERILIIGAHYDDAELGGGGTIAKLASLGKEVYKLTLTDNAHQSEHLGLDVDYGSSCQNSHEASRILGVVELEFEPLECTRLVYSKETMQRVEDIIFTKKIDTVFMHFQTDYNEDHVEAHKICKTAARHCSNILTYQSNGYTLAQPYYPVIFSDISQYADIKRRALAQYDDQHNRFGRLFDMTMDRNRTWGYAHHCDYAEAFHPIKMDLGL